MPTQRRKPMKPIIFFMAWIPFYGNLIAQPKTDPTEVLVTVNDVEIREHQFIAESDLRINVYAAKSAAKGLAYEESSRELTRQSMREEVMHALIERELIAQQLKTDHLEITAAEIDGWLSNKYRERGLTPEQAKEEMLAQGKTLESVREKIKWGNIAIQKLWSAHAKDKKPMTENEAKLAYSSELASYHQQHERRVSRILIEASRDHDDAFRKAAKERAEAILVRAKKGEDFALLAKTCSDDSLTATRGGDRGWSPRGFVTVPGNDPFGDAAFAMKNIGDVSDVVETLDGYEIIKLTGLKEEKQKSYEEARSEIFARDHFRVVGKFWNEYFTTLKNKAHITWSPAELIRKQEREIAERESSQQARKPTLMDSFSSPN